MSYTTGNSRCVPVKIEYILMRFFWPAWELGWWKLVCASSTCYMVHGNPESEHFFFMFSINKGPLPWGMGKNCYIQIWDARMVKMFYITFLMRRYGSVWWAFSLPKFETICTIWSYVIVAYSCCMVMIYVWLFLTLWWFESDGRYDCTDCANELHTII